MKKILYIWKGAYPWDVRVDKICKSLVKANYNTTILCRWNNELLEKEEIEGLKIIRVGYKLKSSLTLPVPKNPIWQKSIQFTINDLKPDLIIVREIMLATDSAKVAKQKNIPIIMDMAENYPAAMKDWKKYRRTLLSKLLVHKLDIPEKVEKIAVKKMDGIITVCLEQNQRLISEYNYNSDKLCVVHNTPNIDQFPDYKTIFNNGKLVFGHHGFTTDEKSLVNFVKGFIKAYDNDKNIELHIAGDGESITELKELASKSIASEKIIFTGKYEHNDLNKILNTYDVGILPYQLSNFNNFTIHNKIFDFFAFGLPVFVSKTNPFVRMINETNAGITVNCEDIEEISRNILLFKNQYDLKKMGNNGRLAFINKYNWENDFNNLLNFLQRYL